MDTKQIRLEDFRQEYAHVYAECLASEARANASRAEAIAAEERVAGRIEAVMERFDSALERTQRAEAAVTLALDTLETQAQAIASMFQEQLVQDEVGGMPTLRALVAEMAATTAKSTAKALNDAADEAAAVAGVKAETAAVQRVTAAVIEMAKQGGIEGAVTALVGASKRLQDTALSIEATSQSVALPPLAPPERPAFRGEGAVPYALRWTGHHLGSPGLLAVLAVLGYVTFKLFTRT